MNHFLFGAIQANSGWSDWLIRWIIHPGALTVVLLTCFAITVALTTDSMRKGRPLFVRTLAAALLPLAGFTLIYVMQPASLASFVSGYNGTALFVGAFAVSFVLLFLAKLDSDLVFPLGALCGSGVFSLLVYTYAASDDPRVFILYYGVAIGTLVHVIFFGWGLTRQISNARESSEATKSFLPTHHS